MRVCVILDNFRLSVMYSWSFGALIDTISGLKSTKSHFFAFLGEFGANLAGLTL